MQGKRTPIPHPFSIYLREMREAAGKSQRALAAELGISAVYLSEVERGARGPLVRARWQALVDAIPGVTLAQLAAKAEVSRSMRLDVSKASPAYQQLAIALGQCLREQTLTDATIARVLRLIGAPLERQHASQTEASQKPARRLSAVQAAQSQRNGSAHNGRKARGHQPARANARAPQRAPLKARTRGVTPAAP